MSLKFLEVLLKGRRLANPEVWKQTQVAVSLLVPILLYLTTFFPGTVQISEEDITTIANAIVIMVGIIINLYITVASTRKIGL